MAESILLTAVRVSTFDGDKLLTGASGFFFLRDERLFFVTSRHVFIDAPTKHFPNRVEIELHTDAVNLTQASALSVWLYVDGKSIWRQGSDTGGEWATSFVQGNNFSLSLTVYSKEETDRLFNGLSAGGTVTMPLADTFWGDYFGMFTDKFGINWMISYAIEQAV